MLDTEHVKFVTLSLQMRFDEFLKMNLHLPLPLFSSFFFLFVAPVSFQMQPSCLCLLGWWQPPQKRHTTSGGPLCERTERDRDVKISGFVDLDTADALKYVKI